MDLVEKDKKKITEDFCKMIQCKTVSYIEPGLTDKKEFEKFTTLLTKCFPKLYSTADVYKVGNTGLVHKIKGINNIKGHGIVLMAHYDVVPAVKEEWSFEPFIGDVKHGRVRGRGTMDTKGTLCACLEAVELNLKNGWKPAQDLYLCFSGEEEINGSTCSDIVDWFIKKNITVDFVLDEGGAIVENCFPGVSKPCAMVGTEEKGSTYLDLIVSGETGHASAPPKNSCLGLASKIVNILEEKSPKAQYTPTVKELFKTMAKYNNNGFLSFLFKNLWLTKPVVNALSKKMRGDLYALTHTTLAVTKASASESYNVLPSSATIGMNFRLLGKDTTDKLTTRILKKARKITGKKAVVDIKIVSEGNPSRVSSTNCPEWNMLSKVIKTTWPEVIVSPYLMMACSDSRHYCRITDKVYRFSAMYMSKEDRAMIHGVDESIKVDVLLKTVEFYCNLLQEV